MAANLTKAAIDYNPSGFDGKGDTRDFRDRFLNDRFRWFFEINAKLEKIALQDHVNSREQLQVKNFSHFISDALCI
jgi:hypothetical protein